MHILTTDHAGNKIETISEGITVKEPTIEDMKDKTFSDNTIIEDNYGNVVKIPEGFKITPDSANNVLGGVVIEDVGHGTTAGSQFVWVPVGNIYTNEEKTQSKSIILDRYLFPSGGTPIGKGGATVNDYVGSPYCYCVEPSPSSSITQAKNLEGFKNSAVSNKGYYIGRYEGNNMGGKLVTKQGLNSHLVNQSTAASLARNMYTSNKFTSDLISSYAWDTALVFIQTCSGATNYAQQNSLRRTWKCR